LEDQRLTLQLPEIIAPPIAWGGYNVMRNVPQGHVNFKRNLFPILHLLYALYSSTKPPDVFNQTEWKGMLSSFFLLNMKRLVILKQQQKKTLITKRT